MARKQRTRGERSPQNMAIGLSYDNHTPVVRPLVENYAEVQQSFERHRMQDFLGAMCKVTFR